MGMKGGYVRLVVRGAIAGVSSGSRSCEWFYDGRVWRFEVGVVVLSHTYEHHDLTKLKWTE